jgi:aldehyde dehydrogenase (NAD+)
VEIAIDTEYGLAGDVAGSDLDQARSIARRIRSGWITINDAVDFHAPFGGYRTSGNGREWGEFGFHDYLEIKGTLGYAPEVAGS